MKIFSGIAVFLYTAFFVVIGLFLVAVSSEFVSKDELQNLIEYIAYTPNLRIITGISGLLIILISISLFRLTLGKVQRQKNIAFTNPDGQVSISLFAIEDFIKRIGGEVEEVKELKSDVTAGKKGIEIYTKVALWSETNIPEVTGRIQALIKQKVQEMLGIEEAIAIKVHVTKIIEKARGGRRRRGEKKEARGTDEAKPIPFRGLEYNVEE